MSAWLFALVVLLFGVGLAYFLDRLRGRKGSTGPVSESRRERAKWLHFWFYGRFPTPEEERREEREREREDEGPEGRG